MEKLNRDQMIGLVARLQRGEVDDDDIGEAMESLIQSTGNPQVSDLIFYPESDDVSAEQIVDKALARRPIEL